MHENDWNSTWIVGLEKIQPCFFHHIVATQHAQHIEEEQVVRRPEIRDRSGKICFQWPHLPLHSRRTLIVRSSQSERSIRSLKIERSCNRCTQSKMWRKLFFLRGGHPDPNQCSTDTILSHVFFDKRTFDLVRLLKGCEIIRRPDGGKVTRLKPQMVSCILAGELQRLVP